MADDSSYSEIQARAEALVVEGVLKGRRVECCAEACAELQRAFEQRSSDVVIWLDTCARLLSAHEAAPIVLSILESNAWPEDVRLAAMDAARSVARETPYAARTAERLIFLADLMVRSHPQGSRALMGAMILDASRGIGWFSERLERWPSERLKLSIERAAMIIARIPPSERGANQEFRVLRERVVQFEARLRPHVLVKSIGAADRNVFAYAEVLGLLAVLAPLAPLPDTIRRLLCVYVERNAYDVVVLSGVVDAAWILFHEHPNAESIVRALPNGEELFELTRRARIPRAYLAG